LACEKSVMVVCSPIQTLFNVFKIKGDANTVTIYTQESKLLSAFKVTKLMRYVPEFAYL